jgi:hypothetical protein
LKKELRYTGNNPEAHPKYLLIFILGLIWGFSLLGIQWYYQKPELIKKIKHRDSLILQRQNRPIDIGFGIHDSNSIIKPGKEK